MVEEVVLRESGSGGETYGEVMNINAEFWGLEVLKKHGRVTMKGDCIIITIAVTTNSYDDRHSVSVRRSVIVVVFYFLFLGWRVWCFVFLDFAGRGFGVFGFL